MAKKIVSIRGLYQACKAKRSVTCPNFVCFKGPLPAAFVINLQGMVLLRLFKSGLYLYKKVKKESKR